MANDHIEPVRGTIIIADHVYHTLDRKWVISGTYNAWETDRKSLLLYGIHAYIRLQFDRPGEYELKAMLINRSAPPTVPPIVELGFLAKITHPLVPWEAGLRLPELVVKCPVAPTKRPRGKPIAMVITLWLRAAGHAVASQPLIFTFRHPKDPPHAHRPVLPPPPAGQLP